jgi:hypothetical protein
MNWVTKQILKKIEFDEKYPEQKTLFRMKGKFSGVEEWEKRKQL